MELLRDRGLVRITVRQCPAQLFNGDFGNLRSQAGQIVPGHRRPGSPRCFEIIAKIARQSMCIGTHFLQPQRNEINAVAVVVDRRPRRLGTHRIRWAERGVHGGSKDRFHALAPGRVFSGLVKFHARAVHLFAHRLEGASSSDMAAPEFLGFLYCSAFDEARCQLWPGDERQRHIHIFRKAARDLHGWRRQSGQKQQSHRIQLLDHPETDGMQRAPLRVGQSSVLQVGRHRGSGVQRCHPDRRLLEHEELIGRSTVGRSAPIAGGLNAAKSPDRVAPHVFKIQPARRPQLPGARQKLRRQARIVGFKWHDHRDVKVVWHGFVSSGVLARTYHQLQAQQCLNFSIGRVGGQVFTYPLTENCGCEAR